MFIHHFVSVVLLTLLLSNLFPGNASANMMGNPLGRGDRLSEPIGEFRQLHIVSEDLLLDLRSLPSDKTGQVNATYQIENRGSETTVDLTFISPGIQDGTVSLDGTAIASQPVKEPAISESWMRSVIVPTIQNQPRQWLGEKQPVLTLYELEGAIPGAIPTEENQPTALSFRPTLPPGIHQLQVSYRLNPYTFDGDGMYREFLVGYLLAPAKTWASFGTLDIQVNVPSGWESATSLPLDRQNNSLQASFSGIPADGFAIATRPPFWLISRIGSIALQAFGWLTGLFTAWLLGTRIGRRANRQTWNVGRMIAASALSPALGGAIAFATVLLGNLFAHLILNPDLLSVTWSYGNSIAQFILLPLLALILGMIVTLATLLITRYRKRSL